MNADTIIQCLGLIVLPVLAFIIGWLVTIRKDLDAHKLHVAENYAKKDDLRDALLKIENVLEKIFDRINTIADRRVHQGDENDG